MKLSFSVSTPDESIGSVFKDTGVTVVVTGVAIVVTVVVVSPGGVGCLTHPLKITIPITSRGTMLNLVIVLLLTQRGYKKLVVSFGFYRNHGRSLI